jgi:butyryl-CoA dehydrogenase
MGRLSISNGLQILGGYGFCTDFPLQQYYRDVRIMALYEGTTGIQSLDLLGRKVTMMNGKSMQLLTAAMNETIEAAQTFDELKPYAEVLKQKIALTQDVLQHLLGFAMKGDFQKYLADATLFMEFASTIVIAWQWLKQGLAAKNAQVVGDKTYSEEFYESKIHTMKFYFRYEVPKTDGLAQTLKDPEFLTIVKEKELIV